MAKIKDCPSTSVTTTMEQESGHEDGAAVAAVVENLRLVGPRRQQQQQQQLRCCRTKNSHCLPPQLGRKNNYYRSALATPLSLLLLILMLLVAFVMGGEQAALAASTTSSVLLQSGISLFAKNSPEIQVATDSDAIKLGEDDWKLFSSAVHPFKSEDDLRRHLRGTHYPMAKLFKFRLLNEELPGANDNNNDDEDDNSSTAEDDDREMNDVNVSNNDNDDNGSDDDDNSSSSNKGEDDDNDSASKNDDELVKDTGNNDNDDAVINGDKAGGADEMEPIHEKMDAPSLPQTSLPSNLTKIGAVETQVSFPADESEVMVTSAATGGGSGAAAATEPASAATEGDSVTTTTTQILNVTKATATPVNEDDDVVVGEGKTMIEITTTNPSKEGLLIQKVTEAEVIQNIENTEGNTNYNGSKNKDNGDDKNDEYVVLEPGDEGGITALEGEIDNIEVEIEALEEEDDDGKYAQSKEEYIEDMKELEQEDTDALEKVLLDKIIPGATNTSNTSISKNVSDVVVDPSLTMDWTTLNPPDMKDGDVGSELETSSVSEEKSSNSDGPATENVTEPVILYNDDDDNAAIVAASSLEKGDGVDDDRTFTGDNDAAGTMKEAVSPPSKMDTEPDRPHVNITATPVAEYDEEETESKSANHNTDSELDSVIAASNVVSQEDGTIRGPTNATNATTIAGPTNTSSSAEVGDVPTGTVAPVDQAPESKSTPPSPTPSITSMRTSSPTPIPTEEEYEVSTDDTPPTTNKPPAKKMDDDETSDNDDAISEEVLPPTTKTGEANDWDTTAKDEFYKEEQEEVKKVGGWLSFVSVILLVYTAYQMSENPDGICASMCRLVITVLGCVIKIMLIPLKYVVGGGRPSGGHYMATPDYRDPYGSRHMELT